VTDPARPWTLVGFGAALDAWIERDKPGPDLSYLVTEWVLSRLPIHLKVYDVRGSEPLAGRRSRPTRLGTRGAGLPL